MDLYSSEQTEDAAELMDSFFTLINLPTITEQQRHALNGPITKQELINAIKSLQNGKSPGLDGFSVESC